MFFAQLYYVNYQPQNILIQAENERIAMAAAKKFAAMNGGELDRGWPGTRGHGVGLVADFRPTREQAKKFPIIQAVVR